MSANNRAGLKQLGSDSSVEISGRDLSVHMYCTCAYGFFRHATVVINVCVVLLGRNAFACLSHERLFVPPRFFEFHVFGQKRRLTRWRDLWTQGRWLREMDDKLRSPLWARLFHPATCRLDTCEPY